MSRRKCCCKVPGGGDPPPSGPCKSHSGFTQQEYQDEFSSACVARDGINGWFGYEVCKQDYIDQADRDLVECYNGMLYSHGVPDSGFILKRNFDVPNGMLESVSVDVFAQVDLGFLRVNRLDYDTQGLWKTGNFGFGSHKFPYPTDNYFRLSTSSISVEMRTFAEYWDQGVVNQGMGDLTLPLNQAFYEHHVLISNNGAEIDRFVFETPLSLFHNGLCRHVIRIKQLSAVVDKRADFNIGFNLPNKSIANQYNVSVANSYPCNHDNGAEFRSSKPQSVAVENGLSPPWIFGRNRRVSVLDSTEAAPRFPDWALCHTYADNFSIIQPNL